MGQSHLATIAALHEVRGFERILRAAAVTSAFGKFSLWKWYHLLYSCQIVRTRHFLTGERIIHSTLGNVKTNWLPKFHRFTIPVSRVIHLIVTGFLM